MGASQSRVEINRMMDISASILNETIQKNSSSVTQRQGIYIKEAKGDVNISNLDWSQFAEINTKALASSEVNNNVRQQLTEALSAQATATSESLSLSINNSTNLSNLTTKLSTEIANKFSQECAQQASQAQEIVIGSVGGNVNIEALNWKQFSSLVIESTLNSVATSETVAEIESIIDVGATAEGKGLFSGPLLFIILIILVIGAVVLGVMKFTGGTPQEVIKNKWIWITILGLLSIYLVGGLVTGCCWPFRREEKEGYRACNRGAGCGYNWPLYHEEFYVPVKKDRCCGQESFSASDQCSKYRVPQPVPSVFCGGEYDYHDGEPGNVLPSWT